jgi:uncharacterized membrane protein (UPF0127 family)
MPWLMRDGEVLAAVEVYSSFGSRLRGLLGRDQLDGAIVLRPATSVHTIGMRFPIDVAFCDRELVVLTTISMRRNRMGRPRLKSRCIIEAEAGAFERWRLRAGDRLEIQG